jgi:hypothetical protein
VDSQTDYRAGRATLARKLVEAGADAQRLLAWLVWGAHSRRTRRSADLPSALGERKP